MELTANSAGEHVIFAGGTGILPFYDLLDFLLKKTIFDIMKKKGGKYKNFKLFLI